MTEPQQTPGDGMHSALKTERANHKQARADVVRWRTKYYTARDKAELWEYRAKRYSADLNALREKRDETTDQTTED